MCGLGSAEPIGCLLKLVDGNGIGSVAVGHPDVKVDL
jgi:hypothetical protein